MLNDEETAVPVSLINTQSIAQNYLQFSIQLIPEAMYFNDGHPGMSWRTK